LEEELLVVVVVVVVAACLCYQLPVWLLVAMLRLLLLLGLPDWLEPSGVEHTAELQQIFLLLV
jgi:hypothetical protein